MTGMLTFDEAFRQFPVRIQGQYEAALAQVKAWGQAVPKNVVEWLKQFMPGVAKLGKQIDAMIAKLPRAPGNDTEAQAIGKAWAMKNLWNGIWAPLHDATTITDGPGFGNPLLVPLVGFAVAGVGLVGVSAAGIAWAIAAREYAVALQKQADVGIKEADVEMAELKAREDAAKGGYQLQQTTLRPKPPPAPPPGEGLGWWPVVAVAAVGAAFVAFGGRS